MKPVLTNLNLLLVLFVLTGCQDFISLKTKPKLEPSPSRGYLLHVGSSHKNNGVFGSLEGNLTPRQYAVDVFGNAYAGVSLSLGGFSALSTASGSDTGFMKVNSVGEVEWVKQLTPIEYPAVLTNASNQAPEDGTAATDSDGSTYYVGYTNTDTAEEFVAGAQADVLVTKLDINGNFSWIKQLGKTTFDAYNITNATAYSSAQRDFPKSAIVHGDYLYIIGHTYGSYGVVNDGLSDLFFMKLNRHTGELVKIYQFHYPNYQDVDSNSRTLAIFKNQLVFVAGTRSAIGGETLAGARNMILGFVDLDLTGHTIKHLGANFASANGLTLANINSHHMAVNDTHIAVGFECSFAFKETAQSKDICLMTFDENLDLQMSRHYGLTSLAAGTSHEEIKGIAMDPQGNIYLGALTVSSVFDTIAGAGKDLMFMKVKGSNGDLMWGKQLSLSSPLPIQSSLITSDENIFGLHYHSSGFITAFASTKSPFTQDLAAVEDILIIRLESADGRM